MYHFTPNVDFSVSYKIKILCCTLLCLLFITACSFKPLYSIENISIHRELSAISPEPVDSIYGAEYYDAICDLLKVGENDNKIKYHLVTELKFTKEIAILQSNSDIFRERVVLLTEYQLFDIESKEIIAGQFTLDTTYGVTFTPFVNFKKMIIALCVLRDMPLKK